MSDVHVKLNPRLSWQKQYSTIRWFFSAANCILGKQQVKCNSLSMILYGAETWTLRKADQKYLGKFWNMVLEEDGDQLDRSCEKWRNVT